MKFNKIAAIYTAYKPDHKFIERINFILDKCEIVIVVDNTPGCHKFPDNLKKIKVIQDGVNKGLGSALNIGITAAKKLQCDAVLLLDQDSTPDKALLDKLEASIFDLGIEKICVGPKFIDDGVESYSNLNINKTGYVKVSCLPTSGMMFGIAENQAIENFSEELFLDFVDFDWCWRMGKNYGWSMYCIPEAEMPHRLGLAQKSFFGLKYHIPSPFRHYFQFRDTLKLISYVYVPTYSKFRLGVILFPKLLIYPWILDNGIERLQWMLKGIRDFFNGISGVGSARNLLK